MAQAFAETSDGEKVRIRSQTFNINETIIAWPAQTSTIGESRHKNNKNLPKDYLNVYLKLEHEHIGWTPNIHISYFKPEWQHVITTVQCNITYEGRFSTIQKY